MLFFAGIILLISSNTMFSTKKVSRGIPSLLLGTVLAIGVGVFYFNIINVAVFEMLVISSVFLSFVCAYIEVRYAK